MSRPRDHRKMPKEIAVEETADGVRYVLPERMLGGGHLFGAAVLIAGLVIVVVGVWWALNLFANGPVGGAPGAPGMHPLDLLGPTAVILIGGVLWGSGQFIARGRTILELRGTWVLRIERAGVMRWTIRKPMARLKELRVEIGLTQDQTIDEAITASSAIELAVLVADYDGHPGSKPARLVVAYPPHWLESIAHDLAERIARHPARLGGEDARPGVVVRNPRREARRPIGGEDADEPILQPPESTIDVVRTREGLTITVPPLHLWRDRGGGRGAFSIGAMWNTVMAGFTGSAFGFMNSPWYVTLAIGAFWIVGTLIMILAITLGRRTAIIDVIEERSGRSLLISHRSYFGVKHCGWRADELRTIECAPSGVEVNEQPLMQLQVTPAFGGTISYFTGRDEAELQWLARLLREALALHQTRAGPAPNAR